MTARRLAIFGLVILLAVALGVFVRWQVAQNEAAAPPVESAPVAAEPPPQTVAPMPEQPGQGATRPTFDVVRVEPGGEAIIAGRAAPGSEIELLANGNVIGRTKANEAGEFVLMPPPLQPGSHELVLRTRDAGSRQAVTVSVPEPGRGEVLVVVGEPGKPSQVVQAGAPAAPNAGALSQVPGYVRTPAAADTPLRIGAVESEGGRLFVQGSGPPGGRAVIYLNEAPLAEAAIGPDGRWSFTVSKGLPAGDYRVRIDQMGANGKVIARAEVPFRSEGPAVAAVEDAAQPGSSPAAATPASKVAEVPATSPQAPEGASSSPGSAAPTAAAPVPAAPRAETTPASDPVAEPASPPSETAAATEPSAPEQPAAPSASPPTESLSASASATAAPEPDTTASAANPVVGEVQTLKVKRGDNLWQISRRIYGQGVRYSTIYEANSDQIRDPDRIYPGQIFVLPGG